jgi:hypothetical protein
MTTLLLGLLFKGGVMQNKYLSHLVPTFSATFITPYSENQCFCCDEFSHFVRLENYDFDKFKGFFVK